MEHAEGVCEDFASVWREWSERHRDGEGMDGGRELRITVMIYDLLYFFFCTVLYVVIE